MTLSFNVRALGFATISGLLLVPFAACSSDANSVTHGSAGTSGAAPAAAGGGAGGSVGALGGGGNGGGGSPAAGGATGGAGSAGTSGGGSGGLAAAGSGGAGSGGVAGGSAGNAGNNGSAGAGTCTPTSGTQPASGTQHATTGWAAHWNVPCDFTTNGGCSSVLPPERAFDGKGDTRTSIGDTHIKAGSKTAQVIGDTFTFDMKTCNRLSKLVMFSAAPPGNQGSFDTRDFPGTVEVRVASNCTTKSDGSIDGTFGDVVATANEAQPNCQGGACTKPMTINIDPPVAAQCVQLKLTHILALGGGIWWAIDELQAFP